MLSKNYLYKYKVSNYLYYKKLKTKNCPHACHSGLLTNSAPMVRQNVKMQVINRTVIR